MNSDKANKPVSIPLGILTDEECIERTLKGDMAGFEVLYRMHVDRVYAICLRLTASRELAERLTQDVFVQTWEKLSSFRGEAAFTTWLHRLAVNTVLQDRRKEKRRAGTVRPDRRRRSGLDGLLDTCHRNQDRPGKGDRAAS